MLGWAVAGLLQTNEFNPENAGEEERGLVGRSLSKEPGVTLSFSDHLSVPPKKLEPIGFTLRQTHIA